MRSVSLRVLAACAIVVGAPALAAERGKYSLSSVEDDYKPLIRASAFLEGRQLPMDVVADAIALRTAGFVWGVFSGMEASAALQDRNISCSEHVKQPELIRSVISGIDAYPVARPMEDFIGIPTIIAHLYPCLGPLEAKPH
jgi:hypothetical protein